MSRVTGVLSTTQFNHSCIVRCPRWRRVIAPLLVCAMGCIGKGKFGSALPNTNRNCLRLCYAGQPVAAKSSGGDSASTKCVPYGATEGRTGLRCCAQSYEDRSPPFRDEAHVQRAVHGGPPLEDRHLVVAQLKCRPKSFRRQCKHSF